PATSGCRTSGSPLGRPPEPGPAVPVTGWCTPWARWKGCSYEPGARAGGRDHRGGGGGPPAAGRPGGAPAPNPRGRRGPDPAPGRAPPGGRGGGGGPDP